MEPGAERSEPLVYLESLMNYEQLHDPLAMRTINLEGMRLLCDRLGHPQQRFRSVVVSGTNAKGSICSMIYAILRAARLPVGLYTSPHLEDLRERIRLAPTGASAGVEHPEDDRIRHDDLLQAISHIRPAAEAIHRDTFHGQPTYFEALTAAALAHFAERGASLAVLEVGLGGRLDATNAVDPAVSVIGPIGLDHTDILGHDLLAIAKEKAGIMRPGRTVICATQPPAVCRFLRDVAQSQGCKWVEYGRQISATILSHGVKGLRLHVRGLRTDYRDLTLPLIGRHQAENAALAVAAVEALAESGVPHSAVRDGLAQARWPGRIEVFGARPPIVLDGAHNPAAAQALRDTVEELWPARPVRLLVAMSVDKPIQAVAAVLGPMAASVVCTKTRHPRSCDPHQLAEAWMPASRELSVIPDSVDALTYVMNTAAADDVIVVTGSLFLVGELRGRLQRRPGKARMRRDSA